MVVGKILANAWVEGYSDVICELNYCLFYQHEALDAQVYESSGHHTIPAGEEFPGFGEPK
jgi:hypothetical protein